MNLGINPIFDKKSAFVGTRGSRKGAQEGGGGKGEGKRLSGFFPGGCLRKAAEKKTGCGEWFKTEGGSIAEMEKKQRWWGKRVKAIGGLRGKRKGIGWARCGMIRRKPNKVWGTEQVVGPQLVGVREGEHSEKLRPSDGEKKWGLDVGGGFGRGRQKDFRWAYAEGWA